MRFACAFLSKFVSRNRHDMVRGPRLSVDHKSVRVDTWLMVWARVLALGFGALIERLLT